MKTAEKVRERTHTAVSFEEKIRRSYRKYTRTLFIAAACLLLLLFGISFFLTIFLKNRHANRNLSQTLETVIREYIQEEEALEEDDGILQLLHGDSENRLPVNRRLYDFSNGRKIRGYFCLLDAEGKTIASNFTEGNRDAFQKSPFLKKMLSKIKASPEGAAVSACEAPLTAAQACVLTIGRAVHDKEGKTEGYIFFHLQEKSLHECVRQYEPKVLLSDYFDHVLFTTLDIPADPQEKQPEGRISLSPDRFHITTAAGEAMYVRMTRILPERIYIYTLIPLAAYFHLVYLGIFSFLMTFLLFRILGKHLTGNYARENAEGVMELIKAVEAMNSGQEYHISSRVSSELQTLYTVFSESTDSLKKLLEHNNELLERRRLMEIRQLEEQFNPHFVFNVMESIRFQISEDPGKAEEMLLAFSNLMRYSINYGHTKVSLETDISYLNDFLTLQKHRYNENLQYRFEIEDELWDARIPKLLIQPIIENSIKYGYTAGRVLHLLIRAGKEDGKLVFEITDDGKGIPPEELKKLRRLLTEEKEEGAGHIGLRNIRRVLQLMYGEAYGLEIESCPDKETRVRLWMPLEEILYV